MFKASAEPHVRLQPAWNVTFLTRLQIPWGSPLYWSWKKFDGLIGVNTVSALTLALIKQKLEAIAAITWESNVDELNWKQLLLSFYSASGLPLGFFFSFFFLLLPRCDKRQIHILQCKRHHLHFSRSALPVFVCLHHRERDRKTRPNDQTTGRHCMDFVLSKKDKWKGYSDPGAPLQVYVCMRGCMHLWLVDWAACNFSRGFYPSGRQAAREAWMQRNKIEQCFILPLGVLLNGTKTSE